MSLWCLLGHDYEVTGREECYGNIYIRKQCGDCGRVVEEHKQMGTTEVIEP